MEPASGRDSQSHVRLAPDEVTVINWPLRDEGVSAWIAAALATGMILTVGWLTQSWLGALGSAVILAAILWRLWLPVQFEFRRHGLVQVLLGRRRRIPWASIARYEVLSGGVLLYADQANSLAPLRGLFVAWGGRRSAILANLESYLGPTAPAGHSTTASANLGDGQS